MGSSTGAALSLPFPDGEATPPWAPAVLFYAFNVRNRALKGFLGTYWFWVWSVMLDMVGVVAVQNAKNVVCELFIATPRLFGPRGGGKT
jgi:hypothetical protein